MSVPHLRPARNLEIPCKKPKGGALDEEDKEYNGGLASFRVGGEHRIGRTKRFRIVSEAPLAMCRAHG